MKQVNYVSLSFVFFIILFLLFILSSCMLKFNYIYFFVKHEIYLHLHVRLYGTNRVSFVAVKLETTSTNNLQKYGCVCVVTKL
jgi:hypothetical protein